MADGIPSKKTLKMRFAGGTVKHLGSQMYSGIVPAITELIANAWDADAHKVELTIPMEQEINPMIDKIVVKDDGYGMSFNECQASYLILGREKRALEGQTSRGGRPLMGRKGLGKLACFGIAKQMEVMTVDKNGEFTRFLMDYDDIQDMGDFQDYEPQVIEDGVKTTQPEGTVVILKGLTLQRQIKDAFLKSLARKFLLPVISSDFKIFVNGEELKRPDEDLEFIFPRDFTEEYLKKLKEENIEVKVENGYAVEELNGFGSVKWKIGFSEFPIKVEEARGVSVIAHNKQIQPPWLFGLGKGTTGQLGQQYISGEVIADFLDELPDDFVATDRAGVLWERTPAKEVQDWAQRKIIELLRIWNDKRIEKRLKEVKESESYKIRIQKFQTTEKAEINKAIEAVTTSVDSKSRVKSLVEIILNAWENRHFVEMIRRINAVAPEAGAEILFILEEFKVLEAINIANTVRAKLEVIRKFGEYIETKAKELDLQKHLEIFPWLISWDMDNVEPKPKLKEILLKQFHVATSGGQAETIPDFFCIGDSIRDFVVEIKKAGVAVDKDDLLQIEDYVDFLRNEQNKNSDPLDRRTIIGYIIGDHYVENLRERIIRDDINGIHFRTWSKLLEIAENSHKEYFRVVKERAPQEDPRIKNLEKLDSEIRKKEKDEEYKKIVEKAESEKSSKPL